MAKPEQIIQTTVTAEWVDDLTFKLKFDNPKLPELFIDESHDSNSPEVVGPNPPRLLVSAIMACLSSSFAYCLKRARVPLKAMKAKAIITIKRNEAGFLRVAQIDVELMPEIEIQSGIPRMERCIETFHNYCTVTESVRQGIPVNIKINKDKVKTS